MHILVVLSPTCKLIYQIFFKVKDIFLLDAGMPIGYSFFFCQRLSPFSDLYLRAKGALGELWRDLVVVGDSFTYLDGSLRQEKSGDVGVVFLCFCVEPERRFSAAQKTRRSLFLQFGWSLLRDGAHGGRLL